MHSFKQWDSQAGGMTGADIGLAALGSFLTIDEEDGPDSGLWPLASPVGRIGVLETCGADAGPKTMPHVGVVFSGGPDLAKTEVNTEETGAKTEGQDGGERKTRGLDVERRGGRPFTSSGKNGRGLTVATQ